MGIFNYGAVSVAAVLALALVAVAPGAAADGWMELEADPASASVPTVELGEARVPVPHLERQEECVFADPARACVDVYRFVGFREMVVPGPVVGSRDEQVPFYRVHAWSPATLAVRCDDAPGGARAVTVVGTMDLIGRHNYVEVLNESAYAPANPLASYAVDVACARVEGTVVAEKLLP